MPLARVSHITLKFIVGVLLTGCGMFWGAEGAQAHWPGSEAALLVRIPGIAGLALGLRAGLRRRRRPEPAFIRVGAREGTAMIARIRAFGAFLYDFVVGDDRRVAVAVVIGLAITYGVTQAGVPAWWVLPSALAGDAVVGNRPKS